MTNEGGCPIKDLRHDEKIIRERRNPLITPWKKQKLKT